MRKLSRLQTYEHNGSAGADFRSFSGEGAEELSIDITKCGGRVRIFVGSAFWTLVPNDNNPDGMLDTLKELAATFNDVAKFVAAAHSDISRKPKEIK